MKQIALAVAFLAATGLALAQAPAAPAAPDVPKYSCDPKPEYPGKLAMQSDLRRNSFTREINAYKTCMMGYIEQRKVLSKSNLDAANAAIGEYNDTMKKIAAEQEAAKGN